VVERSVSGKISEMPRRGRNTACCGGGSGRMWFDDAPQQRIGVARVQEAIATGIDTVAVSCPFCLTMISDGLAAQKPDMEAKDIAELLVDALAAR
jgi:Fe-S oxidoreductase